VKKVKEKQLKKVFLVFFLTDILLFSSALLKLHDRIITKAYWLKREYFQRSPV